MDQDTLIKHLMATFLEELEEHVSALNDDLLALENDLFGPNAAERLRSMFRTAHSMKGAARAANVLPIEQVCHRLEGILSAARDGKKPLDSASIAMLFEAVDAIGAEGVRLREQRESSGSALDPLLARLASAAAGAVETPSQPPPNAKSANVVEPVQESAFATVRVPAEKLDTFLARNGELLIARRRVQSRAEDVVALREFVGRWKTEWRKAQRPLTEFFRAGGTLGNLTPEESPRLPRRAVQALQNVAGNLRQMEKDLDSLTTAVVADGRLLKDAAGAIHHEVRRVRMVPFAEACQGLDRLVRDVARATGKEVDLYVEGGAVELDRSVLEGLKAPLQHLVRNAVDHGAELPERRLAAGKPRRLRLEVAAVLRGPTVEVSVSDDGAGINLDALRQQVRRKGMPEPADDRELARVVFQPGFSTASLITDVSGRGVGLDVVKSRVEALHGTVELSFVAGKGTRFTLGVPLTLTTLRVLLVESAGQTFAFPGTAVKKLVRVEPDRVRVVEGRDMLAQGGTPVPIVSLAATLGLSGRETPRSSGKTPAVVVSTGDQVVAFVVDDFVDEQEVVVKGLGARVRRLRHVSAATILSSGKIAPVLNTANLIRSALRHTPATTLTARSDRTPVAKKRILVVDDSVTTRTLEKSILEAAGFDVLTAVDGTDGWRLLQEQGADLIVSDVEMPRMDGFALTEAIRSSQRFRELPVILVTARESDADRKHGIAVQADAYLGKSGFDQKNLLETIAQLL